MTEEPSTREFLITASDAIFSNWLVDTIRRKFQAQSYFEFFNRIWGTGLILFVLGITGLVIGLLLNEYQLSLFDIGNTIILVAVAVLVWIILVAVRVVNVGENPMYREAGPDKEAEVLKIIGGVSIIASLSYTLFWQTMTPIDNLVFVIFSAILVGMWLIGIAWFLGGLSGLLRLRKAEN